MSVHTEQPPEKKIKMSHDDNNYKEINLYIEKLNSANTNLIPIIHQSYFEEIPLVKVYRATIKNAKDISKIIHHLNEKLPLKQLQHLKRVCKKVVLLCGMDLIENCSIQEYLENNFDGLINLLEDFTQIEVPSIAPVVRKQFEVANEVWPCNFHPNKYNEKLVSGNFFTDDELKIHRQYVKVAFETAKFYTKNITFARRLSKDYNVSVIVDPTIHSVVAIAVNNESHPIQHAAMLAIDNVAKTQNGGAWVASGEKPTDVSRRGISEDLYCYLTQTFPELKFGAKLFKSKRDMTVEEINESSDCGPYLCTGYFMYTLREPCIMCSMALVHARVNKVFFCFDNVLYGALKSKTKLQTIASLNHHFEVFTGLL